INLDQYFRFIESCHRLDIAVWVFAMVSFPDETEEDAWETLRVLKESAPYIYKPAVQLTRVYPDAAMHDIARRRGLLPEDFDWFRPYRNRLSPLFGGATGAQSNIGDNIPFYLEALDVDFLQHYFRQVDRMLREKYTYLNDYLGTIRATLGRTLFDWKNEGLAKKMGRVSKAITSLPHLRSFRTAPSKDTGEK
ncbi:MAG: hypothetical protein KJ621_15450, partial [Proteobacteria bacterium]|nr:hypothetical protein [Pseudomonadota bacterium]MBU1743212.1 hypothetical protein [Pseudomonadota bacterium]